MVARQAPPGRTSIATVWSGTSASAPPNQSANASGSVHSRQTRSRGASSTRVIAKPSRTSLIEPPLHGVEALLPEAAVGLEPLGRVTQRRTAQPRRAQLRRAATLDQAGALEHAQVLRD